MSPYVPGSDADSLSASSNGTSFSDTDAVRVPEECSGGSDIQRAKDFVNSLLHDKPALARMTPMDHLAWTEAIPACCDGVDLPALLQEAVDKAEDLGLAEL